MKTVRPLGLYIHIPFCKAKCVYCDFYSLPHGEDRMDAYTDALCAHLTEAAPLAASHTVDTVYFGGGTPSYLGEKRLCKILKVIEKRYQVARDAEITLEATRTPPGIGKPSAPCGAAASTGSPWECSPPATRNCEPSAGSTPWSRSNRRWRLPGRPRFKICRWTSFMVCPTRRRSDGWKISPLP